jgi:regulator of RNase E activity RraA
MPADGAHSHGDLYTGAVYDVLRGRGLADGAVLPSGIAPLDRGRRVVGPAFTVAGELGRIDEHESLLRWTELLSRAPAGSVVVCQPHDDTIAHMGELSAETLQARGVLGYVVDGGCRDTGFVVDIAFPVWCRYTTPADVVGRWAPTELGGAIEIGRARIAPGDVVVADRDGVVCVPRAVAAEVLEEAKELMETESEVRRAIRAGMDPKDAYLRYGAF